MIWEVKLRAADGAAGTTPPQEQGEMDLELLCLLMALALSGVFDGFDIRFQYTARFFCHLVEWYL